MEALLGIFVGVSLAAACGFRVFVPMLVASAAVRADYMQIGESFNWLASDAAFTTLIVATVAELIAYFIPLLDNALDTFATPAAIVAGTLLSGSMMVELDPWLRWSLALIAGGGAAGVIQGSSVVTRAASTMTTAGLGNSTISAGEVTGAALLAILAIAAPVVAIVLVVAIFIFIVSRARRFFGRNARRRPHEQ